MNFSKYESPLLSVFISVFTLIPSQNHIDSFETEQAARTRSGVNAKKQSKVSKFFPYSAHWFHTGLDLVLDEFYSGSKVSRQFQFTHSNFVLLTASVNLLTAISICSRQFQFTHGSFNFTHGYLKKECILTIIPFYVPKSVFNSRGHPPCSRTAGC